MVSFSSHYQTTNDIYQENYQQNSVPKKTTPSRNGMLTFFVVFTFILLGLLLWTNRNKIVSYIYDTQNDTTLSTGTLQNDFFVGKEIGLSGTLIRQGDLTKYTHTLILPNGQMLGLKSTTLALDQYSGNIIIGGTIVDLAQGIYIADVQTVVPISSVVDNIQTVQQESIENKQFTGIVYIPDAGIFFDTEALPDVEIATDYINKKIIFSKTGQTVMINYFLCTKKIADEDCSKLAKTFRDIGSELIWTNQEGDEFFEIPDTSSVFGSLQEKVGYYIKASDKAFLINTLNTLTFVGEGFFRAKFQETATKLCRNNEHVLVTVDTITPTTVDDGKIEVLIYGKNMYDESIVCKIAFDPTYELGGTLVDIRTNVDENGIYGQNTNTTLTGTNSQQSSQVDKKQKTGQTINTISNFSLLTRDSSVQQVPTSTTQIYTHTGKDYTITFPSINLWYNWISLTGDKTLGFSGLSCYGKFHVIAYEKDETLREFKFMNEPKVIIYVCLDNQHIIETLSSFFFVTRQEQKKRMFLIQPVDPAWYDFASQITINEL